jgi:hypothetical protein|tara:strand:- start:366 stop:500 length:135 start_codon:yes stop_codon:yes gene_type:complete
MLRVAAVAGATVVVEPPQAVKTIDTNKVKPILKKTSLLILKPMY